MRVFTKSTIATMWGRGDMRFILEDEAQAEIARLHAELDTANGIIEATNHMALRLQDTLAAEVAHADRLAALLPDAIETENEFWTVWDEEASAALADHSARRGG